MLDDGRVAYRIRYARRGSTHRVMAPVDLLARLAALIPPPRHPLTRCFGVLSSHSKYRSHVVPRLATASPSCKDQRLTPPPPKAAVSTKDGESASADNAPAPVRNAPQDAARDVKTESAQSAASTTSPVAALAIGICSPECLPTTAELQLLPEFNVITARHLERLLGGELLAHGPRLDWAKLLRRSFAIDPFRCPKCGSRMRPIAEITDRDVIDRILEHLTTRESRAPPSVGAAPEATAATLH